MKNHGQALIILIVALPLLLLIFGLIARSGGTILAHDRAENHCNKKILDVLEIQGRALHTLGLINPFAKGIIIARRSIDPLANGGIPYFIAIQKSLQVAQRVISVAQKGVEYKALAQSRVSLSLPTPRYFSGRILESYRPFLPKLHVEAQKGYEDETGPPLSPEDHFSEKQTASGAIKIVTERFLSFWPNFADPVKNGAPLHSKNMDLQCRAKIEMDELEGEWTAKLEVP